MPDPSSNPYGTHGRSRKKVGRWLKGGPWELKKPQRSGCRTVAGILGMRAKATAKGGRHNDIKPARPSRHSEKAWLPHEAKTKTRAANGAPHHPKAWKSYNPENPQSINKPKTREQQRQFTTTQINHQKPKKKQSVLILPSK